MSDKMEEFTKYYECPDCFLNFSIREDYSNLLDIDNNKKCEFCTRNHPTGKELLLRRIKVLDPTHVKKFSIILKQLVDYIELKDDSSY